MIHNNVAYQNTGVTWRDNTAACLIFVPGRKLGGKHIIGTTLETVDKFVYKRQKGWTHGETWTLCVASKVSVSAVIK